MRICRAVLIAGFALAQVGTVACRSAPQTWAEPVEPLTEPSGETQAGANRAPTDPGSADDQPQTDAMETTPSDEPIELLLGGTTTVADGFAVQWGVRSHRHTAGGGASGIWRFVLTDGRTTEVVAVISEKLYAEGRSFGRVWVIEGVEEGDRAFIRLPDAPAESLTEEDANEMTLAKIREHGIKGINRVSHSIANGVVINEYKRDGKLLARGRVCLHTHTFEFESFVDDESE